MPDLLAQADATQTILVTAGRVLLVVIAAVVLLVIGLWLKRKIVGEPERDVSLQAAGFGVGDLRRMHEAGELTDAEYERARDRLVARARKMANDDAGELPHEPDRLRGKDLDLIRNAEE